MSILNYEPMGEYEIMLSAWGEGIVEDDELIYPLDKIYKKFKKKYHRKPKDISLFIEDSMACGYDYGFTGVDTDYLVRMKQLKEIIFPDSIKSIDETPELLKLLKKNDTLIRGSFDSFAEQFAAKHELHFRHSDFYFASFLSESQHESTELKMIFHRSGKTEIAELVGSPGSSAGNTFGGTFYKSLPKKFYKEMTVDDIADMFDSSIRKAIKENGRLEEFLEKAKTHKMYMKKV